jgi:hypothetical protein
MKIYKLPVLYITVLCASILLSILVVGSVATAAQAGDKVKQERIVGTIQPGGIVGDVVEGTSSSMTVSNSIVAKAKEKGDKAKEKGDKAKEKGKEKKKKDPVVIPDPGDPPDPWIPPGCDPNDPFGHGCWDY